MDSRRNRLSDRGSSSGEFRAHHHRHRGAARHHLDGGHRLHICRAEGLRLHADAPGPQPRWRPLRSPAARRRYAQAHEQGGHHARRRRQGPLGALTRTPLRAGSTRLRLLSLRCGRGSRRCQRRRVPAVCDFQPGRPALPDGRLRFEQQVFDDWRLPHRLTDD